MLLPLTLAMVVIAMILLALFGSGETILGVEPGLVASLVSGAAIAVLVLSGGSGMVRGRVREAARDAALWALILFAALAAYAYRFELRDVANRVLGEVAPGYAVTARGGEVTIARARGGSFLVAGRINGRDARFIFDTGASAVVLTDATARAAGIDPSTLSYTVGVATANGRTTAARVRLDRLSIGDITEDRVEALVARPGTLAENLLGMSFLERLASYEVRDDRLIMRGGR
jgi:aspartyl protease family protein